MKKRLLYIPQDYHLRPNKAWFDAFCEQFECEYWVDSYDAIFFEPDYIFMQSGAIDANTVKYLKDRFNSIIMQWTGDCRPEPLSEVINTPSDITFLASGITQKEMYEALLGHKVHYLQHAAHEFREVNTNASGVVFIGNNYDQFPGGLERNALCETLVREIPDFKVYGSGYDHPIYNNANPIPYTEISDLYNKSYIAISASIYNYLEGYWSNRPLDIMAAGCCCLMRYTPGLEEWFTDGHDCVFYDTEQDAIRLIGLLKSKPALRNNIAKRGQETIQKYHTYQYRVKEIMEVLKEYEKGK